MRKLLFCSNIGLGDIINYNGMIRYLRNMFDIICIFCRGNDLYNITKIYEDDKNITFYTKNIIDINSIRTIINDNNLCNRLFPDYEKLIIGNLKQNANSPIGTIPFNFYLDANISPKIFWSHFKCSTPSESIELFDKLNQINHNNKPICFIENYTSYGKLFNINNLLNRFNLNQNNLFLVTPNEIQYNKDFYNNRLINYKTILENSDYIFVTDSAFACLIFHLNLKKNCKFILFERNGYGDYSFFYNNSSFSPPNEILNNIVPFKCFNYKNL